VKKRNEQSTAGGAFHPAIFHPLPISHPGPISHRDRFPIRTISHPADGRPDRSSLRWIFFRRLDPSG
jgi:hypothetical protein